MFRIIHLQHKDRILFGANHLYVFLNPLDENECSIDIPMIITWEFAQIGAEMSPCLVAMAVWNYRTWNTPKN